MGDTYITLKTKNNHDKLSIIEVKLPNPYLNIDKPERNKTIEYKFKSRFKSPYADYINHSLTNSNFNIRARFNKRFMNSDKCINNKIFFMRKQMV